MDVPATSFQQHERDIHALLSGTDDVRVTKVVFTLSKRVPTADIHAPERRRTSGRRPAPKRPRLSSPRFRGNAQPETRGTRTRNRGNPEPELAQTPSPKPETAPSVRRSRVDRIPDVAPDGQVLDLVEPAHLVAQLGQERRSPLRQVRAGLIDCRLNVGEQ